MKMFSEFTIRQLLELAPDSLDSVSAVLPLKDRRFDEPYEHVVYVSTFLRDHADGKRRPKLTVYIEAGIPGRDCENHPEMDHRDNKLVGWIVKLGRHEAALDEYQSATIGDVGIDDLDDIRLFAPNHGFNATYMLRPMKSFGIEGEW